MTAESLSSEAGLSEVKIYSDGRVRAHGVHSTDTNLPFELELNAPGAERVGMDAYMGMKIGGKKEIRAKFANGAFLVYDPDWDCVEEVDAESVLEEIGASGM